MQLSVEKKLQSSCSEPAFALQGDGALSNKWTGHVAGIARVDKTDIVWPRKVNEIKVRGKKWQL